MTFQDIVGTNPKFQQVINIAKAAASSSSNVLLLGKAVRARTSLPRPCITPARVEIILFWP